MENKYLNNLEYSFKNGVLEFKYNKNIREGYFPHTFRVLTIKDFRDECRPYLDKADKLTFGYEFAVRPEKYKNNSRECTIVDGIAETIDEIFKGLCFLLDSIILSPDNFPSRTFFGNDTCQLLNEESGLAYSFVKWNNDNYDISFKSINNGKKEISMSFYDLSLEDLKTLKEGFSKIL